MQRLDVHHVPLDRMNLIEAGAGTGKTYTIVSLFLRLLLDSGISVDRILVLTYTIAATDELRERVRDRLASALAGMGHDPHPDLVVEGILSKIGEKKLIERRLVSALQSLDEAAILTIHGFCQRVLGDQAFQSGMPFDTEVLVDETELLQEAVEDFWRREIEGFSAGFVDYLIEARETPETLFEFVLPYLGKPDLTVLGAEAGESCQALEARYEASYRDARRLWRSDRDRISQLLLGPNDLKANLYRPASLAKWLDRLDRAMAGPRPHLNFFPQFEKLSSQSLSESVKKGGTAPSHAFFEACGALSRDHRALSGAYAQHRRHFLARLLDDVRQEMEKRKDELGLLSYDDLLIRLRTALSGSRGADLARSVRGQFEAALIDEFQDTDTVQYDIFRRIYSGRDLPVFLVGDPKQAIYSFRGADIFAYLRAQQDVARSYTLTRNWRSHPALIGAANALFGSAQRPFLFDEIPFQEAVPANEGAPQQLTIEGRDEAGLELWFLEDESGKPVSKSEAGERIARSTAAEISRLLNLAAQGRAAIDGRPVGGGDIAILVRSHRQGRLVRDRLADLGIPCVQQVEESVFHTPQARELERILLAVSEPGREVRVRAALGTELLGVTGSELERLSGDESGWSARIESFRQYHQLWQQSGFLHMFRELMAREGVAARQLEYRNGERRLTNIFHLAELLQAGQVRFNHSMLGLIQWLASKRAGLPSPEIEQQLRLESDEHLVKIVTIHTSKGLEYPIVFCPFHWDGHLWVDKDAAFVFHDPARADRAFLDLGSAQQDEFRSLARREELAENLRLLYVAVTRARLRCYLAWGLIKGSGKSPIAWLLHQPEWGTGDGPNLSSPTFAQMTLDRIARHLESRSSVQLKGDLDRLVRSARGAVRLGPLPEAPGEPFQASSGSSGVLERREFKGSLSPGWRVTSFSALTAGLSAELPDHDAFSADSPGATPPDERTFFDFHRGARAGRCLHGIFERLDYSPQPSNLDSVVESGLSEYGFEPSWKPIVSDAVLRALGTDLGGFRLADMTAGRRRHELEFYFSFQHLDGPKLQALLQEHGYRFPAPRTPPPRGFMKGYIDLIVEAGGRYHLIDFKSNWLGPEPDAYLPEKLAVVVARESYQLQYLIYSLALHRFLRTRISDYGYQSHFGSVYYLFLRGLGRGDPGTGVFEDRPPAALIEALDRHFQSGSVCR